ncbi:MAG: diguanylate cyclase [Syntrophomonadaceae bacterium]|nr:diguanylate cyclase [Syntrophomonadaceae bacterium]
MTNIEKKEQPIDNILHLLQSCDEALRHYGQKYRQMAENSFDMIVLLKPDDFTYLYINSTLQIILGYNPDDLLGKHAIDFIHPEDQQQLITAINNVIGSGGGNSAPYRFRKKNGDYVWLETTGRVIRDEGGTEALLMNSRDVSERKRFEEAIQYRLGLEAAVARSARLFIAPEGPPIKEILSLLGKAVGVNRVYIFKKQSNSSIMDNLFEWSDEKNVLQITKLRNMDSALFPWWMSALSKKQAVIIRNINDLPLEAAAEKEILQAQNTSSLLAVPICSSKQELIGFMGFDDTKSDRNWQTDDIDTLRVVAEMMGLYWDKQLSEGIIQHLSFTDKVTGLYNRAFFEEELLRLDTQRNLPLSIIIGDVNGLKLVNDVFGHQEGDLHLQKAARILIDCCRKGDIIARWGGDEFVILLPLTPSATAQNICQRIKKACSQSDEHPIQLSIATGSAAKEKPEQDIMTVFQQADEAMYNQKLLDNKATRSNFILSLENQLVSTTHETLDHTMRIREMSVMLGCALNLSESELERLALLSSLHDIGEIAVPVDFLKKIGPLNSEEWSAMQKHCEIGYRIVQFTPELSIIAEDILSHHEHWDGSGYPLGLKHKQIPLASRILAIVDAYDVMTRGRAYQAARSPEQAREEIKKCAGTQFDPELVEIFLGFQLA